MTRSRVKIPISDFKDVKMPQTLEQLHVLLATTYNDAFQEGWEEGYHDGEAVTERYHRTRTLD
jgi:flagellar biosynthesis/type III secretory pathway protein FliH